MQFQMRRRAQNHNRVQNCRGVQTSHTNLFLLQPMPLQCPGPWKYNCSEPDEKFQLQQCRIFNTMFTLTFFHIHIRIPLPWWLLPVPMKIQLFKARWGCDASSYCSAPIAQLRRRTEWTYQEYQPNPLYSMPRPVLAPDEVICFFVHPAHHLHTTCTPHAPCWLVTWACILHWGDIIHL